MAAQTGTAPLCNLYWTHFVKIVIVPAMLIHKFSVISALCLLTAGSAGCHCLDNSSPSNPFASSARTVPPPATFSVQESYLGQTPGSFIPQTPATTFPAASSSINDNEKATVFTSTEIESHWTPAETVSTSQTAFQAMEAKANVYSAVGTAAPTGNDSLVVGSSFSVTTISDGTQPASVLAEPQPLYSGGFAQ